ncbi:MAG TPA: hypothetical protein VER79_03220 [Candidatus Limnocylindrales bacterium]|nr:hypothetical protein [Candidatus Limnocylindrales bacterium]
MEIPLNLQSLPPEGLDVLRFFGATGQTSAHADEITERADLSDRAFGKAIRRLVTKGYLIMDGDQVYRLSDSGRRAVADMLEYDLVTPPEERDSAASSASARSALRRLVLAAPLALKSGEPASVIVGFEGAEDDELLAGPAPLVVRFSVVHGEAGSPAETTMQVENRPVQQQFQVTAGPYTRVRLRVQLFQSDESGYEIEPCGGLYADVPVSTTADSTLVAYGAPVTIRDVSS